MSSKMLERLSQPKLQFNATTKASTNITNALATPARRPASRTLRKSNSAIRHESSRAIRITDTDEYDSV